MVGRWEHGVFSKSILDICVWSDYVTTIGAFKGVTQSLSDDRNRPETGVHDEGDPLHKSLKKKHY